MGEDFVSQRQQRTVETVRMKNLREEKMLAMKLGNKGGLEASKRYEMNRFKKEKQRLMRQLDKMKCLKARPRYSDQVSPEVLTVANGVEVQNGEVNNTQEATKETKEESCVNVPTGKDNTSDNDAKTYDKNRALIGYYGLSPRYSEEDFDKIPIQLHKSLEGLPIKPEQNNHEHNLPAFSKDTSSPEQKNGEAQPTEQVSLVIPTEQPKLVLEGTSTSSNFTLPRRKSRRKKTKIERMHEKSAAEFKRAQERMYTFMEALDDKQKWEIFCMFDSALKRRGQNGEAGAGKGQGIPRISPNEKIKTDSLGGRKTLPLNEINIEAIKEHIAKRLSIGMESSSPGSSSSPPYASSSGTRLRKKAIIMVDADGFRSDDGPNPELPLIQEHKHERIRRWTNQQQTIPEAEEPTLEEQLQNGDHKPHPRRRTSKPATLGTIQEGREKIALSESEIPKQQNQAEDHGDWSHRPPPIDGVFMDDFVGQVLYDPELFNPDGSFRAVHMVPEFEQSLAEAKKARYIRYGKDDVPEHEKDLSMNEIFGKSEEDDEFYQLIKKKESEKEEKERDRKEKDGTPSCETSTSESL